MARQGLDTRAAIFEAAAAAFAARGFDGAGVDEIAREAGVNKAMLYYHFGSKRKLYAAVLKDMFGAVAARVSQIAGAGLSPEKQIEAFIEAIADEGTARPHFPAIWLREVAEGVRHVDPSFVPLVQRVLAVLAGIIAEGRKAGRFRSAHPLAIHLGIVGPVLMFLASAPGRERLLKGTAGTGARIDRDAMVRHIKTATLASLATSPRRRRS